MSRQPDTDWPPIEITAAADGSRVSYMRFPGSGPPFLSVRTPGAPTLSLLPRILKRERYDRFRRGRGLIVFDWRGSGRSDPIDETLTLEDLGADLNAVIDVVGSPVDAVLYGRACFAVCQHASRQSDRYRSITIDAGALRADESFSGFYNRPGWQRHYHEHLRGLAEHYFELTAEEVVRFALQWESGVPAAAFGAYLDSEKDIDLTEALPQSRCPPGSPRGSRSIMSRQEGSRCCCPILGSQYSTRRFRRHRRPGRAGTNGIDNSERYWATHRRPRPPTPLRSRATIRSKYPSRSASGRCSI